MDKVEKELPPGIVNSEINPQISQGIFYDSFLFTPETGPLNQGRQSTGLGSTMNPGTPTTPRGNNTIVNGEPIQSRNEQDQRLNNSNIERAILTL